MNVFYNYIAYINDKPIYVGKGKNKRYIHCYKKFPNCIVKLYNQNSSEKEAFNWEINKIEEIGLENLANKVPGGFGVDTISKNPNKHDICKRISETVKKLHKNGVYPPKYWLNGVKGMLSKESVRKRTETQKGVKKYIKNKEAWRKKISESLKGEKHPMFGKKSWNSGKKMHIKNLELANQRKSQAAKNRKKFKCQHCSSIKEYDAGNLSKHIKAYHTNNPEKV
ncbi:MAG: hypothetical protein EBV07_00660 [Proteobacteria bacterium]|nr:hypothetical protein [Pseudomonadota bacterium]